MLNDVMKKSLILVCAVFVVLLGFIIVKMAASAGEIEYCYVEIDGYGYFPIYKLYGYRSWRRDRRISVHATFDEVKRHAESINCPLK